MKLIKVVDKTKKFKTKKGTEIPSCYYAIVHENGSKTLIKPCYNSGYGELDVVAELIIKEGN